MIPSKPYTALGPFSILYQAGSAIQSRTFFDVKTTHFIKFQNFSGWFVMMKMSSNNLMCFTLVGYKNTFFNQ